MACKECTLCAGKNWLNGATVSRGSILALALSDILPFCFAVQTDWNPPSGWVNSQVRSLNGPYPRLSLLACAVPLAQAVRR